MFKRTINAIERLVDAQYPVSLDTVISKSNIDQFEDFLAWISGNIPTIRSVYVHFFLPYNGLKPEEVLSSPQISHAYQIIDKYNKSSLANKVALGIPVPFCTLPQEFKYLRWGCSAGWILAHQS